MNDLKNKKVLITGGLGFIGKSFTNNLLKNNVDIIIMDNFVLGKKDFYTKNATIIEGDVRNYKDWKKLPKCDYVFHLGAPSSIVLFNKNLSECVGITLQGLQNCFKWAIENNCEKVIYPSSGSIFGTTQGACSETTFPSPQNSYGKTKLACEYIAKIYEDYIPSLGLRIFAGYGPQEDHKGEIASVVTLFLNDILQNKRPVIFGNGKQTRDFVYIDDILNVLYVSISKDLVGVLNVGSGEAISFNNIILEINRLLGKNIKPRYIKTPKNYLENTLCNTDLLVKVMRRNPFSFSLGIKKYLEKFSPTKIKTS